MRKQLFGSIANPNQHHKHLESLNVLSTPKPREFSKYHQTNFKIKKNCKILKNVISSNLKFVNQQVISLPSYQKTAPLDPAMFQNVNQIRPQKQLYKNNFGFDQKNLKRNKLQLQNVVINRLVKKSISHRKLQQAKIVQKKLLDLLSKTNYQ